MQGERDITGLAEMVATLPPEARETFERIFLVTPSIGRCDPPPAMFDWIEEYFDSVDDVREQRDARQP